MTATTCDHSDLIWARPPGLRTRCFAFEQQESLGGGTRGNGGKTEVQSRREQIEQEIDPQP